MKKKLFNIVSIFLERCEVSKLHCYDVSDVSDDSDDSETCIRCDFDRKHTFHIAQYIDDETDEIEYIYHDYHDSDGCYEKCTIERAIEIVTEQARIQGVFLN